jgi:hypothetical protein
MAQGGALLVFIILAGRAVTSGMQAAPPPQ